VRRGMRGTNYTIRPTPIIAANSDGAAPPADAAPAVCSPAHSGLPFPAQKLCVGGTRGCRHGEPDAGGGAEGGGGLPEADIRTMTPPRIYLPRIYPSRRGCSETSWESWLGGRIVLAAPRTHPPRSGCTSGSRLHPQVRLMSTFDDYLHTHIRYTRLGEGLSWPLPAYTPRICQIVVLIGRGQGSHGPPPPANTFL
jgi:hypothetical protein